MIFESIYSRMCVYLSLMQEPEAKPLDEQSASLVADMLKSVRCQAVLYYETKRDKNYVGDYVWKHDIRKECEN